MYVRGTDLRTLVALANTRSPTEMERLKGDRPTEEQFNWMDLPNTTGSGCEGVMDASGNSAGDTKQQNTGNRDTE